jgi:hypothetical protein
MQLPRPLKFDTIRYNSIKFDTLLSCIYSTVYWIFRERLNWVMTLIAKVSSPCQLVAPWRSRDTWKVTAFTPLPPGGTATGTATGTGTGGEARPVDRTIGAGTDSRCQPPARYRIRGQHRNRVVRYMLAPHMIWCPVPALRVRMLWVSTPCSCFVYCAGTVSSPSLCASLTHMTWFNIKGV